MAPEPTTHEFDPEETRRRSLLARVVPPVLTVLVLAALGVYLWKQRAYIAESYALDTGLAAGALALNVVALVSRSFANRALFSRLGVHASFRDWFGLVTMSAFTNYLPFAAGLFTKALYLKQVHRMPLRLFALGQTALLVLIGATNGLVGLVALAVWLPASLVGVVGLGFLLMASTAAVLFLPERWTRSLRGRFLPEDGDSPARLRRAWPDVAFHQALVLLATAGAFTLCFAMGSQPVGFGACLVFTASMVLTRLVAITPGALGIREVFIAALASLVGFEYRDALIAASVARAFELVVTCVLGGAFTWSFSRRVGDSFERRS